MMLHRPDIKPMPLAAALPPEAPLPMPTQSLRERRQRAPAPGTGPKSIALRRLLVFGGTAAMTAFASQQMVAVLQVGGITPLEAGVLGLFVLLFAWIALSFVSTVVGFFAIVGAGQTLGIDPAAPLPALTSRTALLLPTYNEPPHFVAARLQAIYESVRATGRLEHFDFFMLSDTTDPAVWVEEEAAFVRLRERTGASCLYYRHRTSNVGRKAGNIAEWVSRFGGAYRHMIVLDADSLMEGDTVVRLAAAMDRNPRVGLIQTLPVLINGNTLFARLQQFAGRVYGPLIARGIAWWHGAEGNYWGHNAIIRVEAFAGQAGLPQLNGRKPFGGHILSHDFVEAALLRRAGWGVHMAPNLGGSYEECPPTLTDHAVRDRRWCQGNLQHVGVVPARRLHWISRLHLVTGIGGYLASPLWLLFLLLGILIALQAQFVRPEYFSSGVSLFPEWPAQDPVRAAYVFSATMSLLVLPKLLGYLAILPRRRERLGIGGTWRGLLSVVFEIVVSALIAPVIMLMQSRAVLEILIGRDAGWSAQRRGDGALSRAELRSYLSVSLFGLALASAAIMVSVPLVVWMLPVVAGWALAVPLAAITARTSVGCHLRDLGLLSTPEERTPPALVRRANALAGHADETEHTHPLARLAHDAELCAAHLAMLPPPSPRRRGDVDVVLAVAIARIDQAANRDEAIAVLDGRETFAVLADPAALARLLAKPEHLPFVDSPDNDNLVRQSWSDRQPAGLPAP
jgi:membrane glycosyltransferase